MNPVSVVSHSPLTQSDITRLPLAAQPQKGASAENSGDAYVAPKKSSALKKTIWTLIGLAAVAVGLKYWGRNSFMKFDPNNMKWFDHIKKYTMIAADYVEKPFLYGWNKIKGWLPKKAA